MARVSLAEVPESLGAAFAAGDPESGERAGERTHVERLGQMFHAIAGGRYDGLRALLTDDVTFELAAPVGFAWVRRAAGADEVVAAIAANFASVRDQRPEPLVLAAQGDTVMVMGRETGRWAEGGEPYQVLVAQQFSFRDGRLAAFRSVVAEAGASAA